MRRAMVVLGLVLPLMVCRAGLADDSTFLETLGPVAVGISSTLLLPVSMTTLAGTSQMLGEQEDNERWAIACLTIAAATTALGGLNVGLYGDNKENLTIGISALTMSAANLGVGIAYFVLRDKYKSDARVFPTTWADREGNVVPGVALQVVGW